MGVEPLSYVRSSTPLAPGEHDVRYDFDYDGGGLGRGGTGTLSVDGLEVGRGRVARTTAFLFNLGEGLDVGIDLYTPVTSEYAQGDNAFTGRVEWVRIDVGESEEPTPEAAEEIALAIQ